jgi:hypothetical protein
MMTAIAGPAMIEDHAQTAAIGGMPRLGRQETILHICLFAVTLAAYSIESVPEIVWTAILPGILLILLTWGAVALYKADPLYLLTAGFWFRICAAASFGLGGLWRVLGTEATVTKVLMISFNANQEEMDKAQLVVIASICIIIAVSNFVDGGRRKVISSGPIPVEAEKWLPASACCCFLIGIPVLAYFGIWQMEDREAITSGLGALGNLAYLGIFLAVYAGVRGNMRMLLLGIAGTVLLVLNGAVLANKTAMLGPVLMAAIAHLVRRVKLVNAAMWGVCIGLMFPLSASYVTYARQEALRSSGTLYVGLAERLRLIQNYLSGDRGVSDADPDFQSWLARISYLPYQAFAVVSYDAGRPGTSLDHALYAFVPRFLMPDKPEFHPGFDFNEALIDLRNNQTTPTLVADGYYVGGWPGVVFWMSLYGAVIGFYSREALRRLRAGHILFFPVIVMALQAGQNAADLIVDVLLGPGVIIAYAYAASCAAHYTLQYLWSGINRLTAT